MLARERGRETEREREREMQSKTVKPKVEAGSLSLKNFDFLCKECAACLQLLPEKIAVLRVPSPLSSSGLKQ